MASTVIKWPLELDDSGRFALARNDAESWQLRLKALLTTRIGERAMRSTYGCFLPQRLFDSIHPTTPEDDIRNAVAQWLPLIKVLTVEFKEEWLYRENGLRDRVVVVEVSYLTPNKQEETLSMSIKDNKESS
jgi:phage baseplate assembly protein W